MSTTAPQSDVPPVVSPDALAVELKTFLAGNKLTLANMTGVVIDLYNFIQSYKTLTENQKTLLLVSSLTSFVNSEVGSDSTLLPVIQTLVPHVVDALVNVANGTINIGTIEKDVKSCWSGLTSCCKK